MGGAVFRRGSGSLARVRCSQYNDGIMQHFLRSAGLVMALLFASSSAIAQEVTAAEVGDGVSCAERKVVASAVRTPQDVRAFVQCAYEHFQQMGLEEARRAFREDAAWRSGSIYVFMFTLEPRRLIFPPNPSLENVVAATLPDAFGPSIFAEGIRIVEEFGGGWWHYERTNPATGIREPKVSYLMGVDVAGTPAAIGAGIYRRDLPGACAPEHVNAGIVDANPSDGRLQEFVRCAAYQIEDKGYFATGEFMTDSRWRSGSVYLFGMDLMGNQVFTSHGRAVNGVTLREWAPIGSARDQFGGRDVPGVGAAFGEAYLYYNAVNPMSGRTQKKVSFVKRVSAFGVPLLLGAGYYTE